jgi:hypothetical protein
MIAVRRFGLGDGLLLVAVLAVAAGARAGYLVFAAGSGYAPGPVQVQGDDALAGLKEPHRFGALVPTAPGYGWVRDQVARLPVSVDATLRWGQCVLGALTAGLYFLFARRAFRSVLVGGLAGFAAALHPFWVLNTAELADGVLATFLVAACLFLGARAGQAGGAFTSLLYGLALAGTALTRAALLPFAFVALLAFLLRCRAQTRGWLLALLAFLGFANGLTPWTLRNFQGFHDVLPITDSTYLHLWMGNNPKATGGPLTEEAVPEALAEPPADRPPRERRRDLAAAALQEVRDNPQATVERRLWAGLYFIFGESWFKDHRLAQPAPAVENPENAGGNVPGSWVAGYAPGVLAGTLLALLLLGTLGWRWGYAYRRESLPAALAAVWVPLPYLLSHAESLSGPRLPLDGVLICSAAFAVVCLVPGLRRGLLHGANDQDPPGRA